MSGSLLRAVIGRRLLATSGPHWNFYPRSAIRELFDQLASTGGEATGDAHG